MEYFFTSDYHLNHWNIVKYTGRSFKSLKQMNETLIRNFNGRVKKNDQVYFLGDFCFKNSLGGKAGEGLPQKAEYFIRQLKCKNIIFVKGNHDCFSKETRILTQKGWKYHNEMKIGELIPTVNLKKKKIEYKPVKNIIINKIKKAYGFKTRTSEGIFSKNHRHLLMRYNRHRLGEKYFIKSSEKIWNYKSHLLLIDSFRSGNKDYNISNNWLRLLAWILTDGGIGKKHNYITIYQSKPKYINEIRKLLKTLKINYKEVVRDRKIKRICGKLLKTKPKIQFEFKINIAYSRYCLNQLQIKNKYSLPNWIFDLSDKQTKLLLAEMVKGDGSVGNQGTSVLWGRKDFLEQVLGLCITHGISSNLVKTVRNDFYLCIHKRNSGIKQIYPNSRYIKNFNDIMWDVSVPNHFIFTELHGKPLITGNSNNSLKTPIERIVIKLGGERINLVHNPAHFDPNYNINIVGHVHHFWKFKRIFTKLNKRGYVDLVNVGVDVWNFSPVTINEIMKEYYRWRKQNGY